MYKIYAIKSTTRDYIYVGLTTDLEKRLERHNHGYEQTTKPYRPFQLIFSEECSDRIQARKREKFYKSGVGKEFLRKIKIA